MFHYMQFTKRDAKGFKSVFYDLYTRVTCLSKTIIELIWTNNPISVTESAILLSEISYHSPVLVCCEEKNTIISCGDFFIQEYQLKNGQCDVHFRTLVSELDFGIYKRSENIEETYEIFANDISNAYDQSYTIIKMKKKLLDVTKPYINLEIKEQIERKHTLQNKYIKYPVI